MSLERSNEVTSEPPQPRDGSLANLVPAAHKRLYRVNLGHPLLRVNQHTLGFFLTFVALHGTSSVQAMGCQQFKYCFN